MLNNYFLLLNILYYHCFDDDNMANRVQKKIIQAFDHYDPSKSYRSYVDLLYFHV